MNYVDICTGLSAPTVAWHSLGWKAVCYAEIEPFPSAILNHHYPKVPNVGDFTTIRGDEYGSVDVLVGGTPCQDFSVAGLRAGMDGKRGQLTVEYAHLAHRLRSRWVVWENVPGMLSIDGGEAFATFLGLLCGHTVKVPAGGWQNSGVIAGAPGSYGLAYRVLDAQHFGVPQRRRRVFVIGHLGDWRRAAAVLFERHGLSGYPPPRREAGQGFAGSLTSRASGGGGGPAAGTDEACAGYLQPVASTGDIAHCLNAGGMGRQDYETETETVIVTAPIAFSCKDQGADAGDISPTLRSMGHEGSHANAGGQVAVAFQSSQSGTRIADAHATLDSNNGSRRHNGVIQGMAVRRLTPRECERLQGFPDDYTLIPYRGKLAADGPRYKALGNSMAVPVMRWIGERMQIVEAA